MKRTILAITLVLSLSWPVSATLIDRGDGLIYCDVLDVTWTADAGMFGGQPYNVVFGWIENYSLFDIEGWWLQTVGECSHQFYNELSVTPYQPIM